MKIGTPSAAARRQTSNIICGPYTRSRSCAVNEVEGPADGLAVGNHEVERIEPVTVRFVADADHHTVDGDGGHGERLAVEARRG